MAGRKLFIIPVFLPHAGCPHRCSFCDQTQITGSPEGIPTPESLSAYMRRFLSYRGKHRTQTQVAFYGGNFLGLGEETIRPLLQAATRVVADGEVAGIRFSTRPDSVTSGRLDFLRQFPVTTVELGVQSMDDEVLVRSCRGHTAADTVKASRLLSEQGYEVGMQIMPGLPGDTEISALDTARQVAGLSPAFVRIYPTVVFEGSLLAQWFRKGSYVPLSLEAAVSLVKKQVLLFRKEKIPVVRMGIPVTGELLQGGRILAGPLHPAFGDLVCSEILLDAATGELEKQRPIPGDISIRVHPAELSRMRGHRSRNIEILTKRFSLAVLSILPDPLLLPGEIQIVLLDGQATYPP